MPTITIYRHGKVDFDARRWVYPRNLRAEINAYNTCAIVEPTSPDVVRASWVITSTMPRSISSADYLFETIDESNPHFDEAALPDLPNLPLPLPIGIWFVIARIFWRMGIGKDCETYAQFNDRINNAADVAIARAEDHNDIAIMGHGVMNRFLIKALIARGYRLNGRPRYTHWSAIKLRD